MPPRQREESVAGPARHDVNVGENEQPRGPIQPTGQEPLPDVPPVGVDPETFRQFQEFQRFQQFQRLTQSTNPPPAPPWTAEGGGLVPVDTSLPPPGAPLHGAPLHGAPSPGPSEVHEQLAGVRSQLAEIRASQAKIEKVTNPPLWRKILRSTPVRWAAGLLILVILAVWGVPALIQHYFGSGNDPGSTDNAGLPQSKGDSGQLPTGPYDAVLDVYRLPAEGFPPSRTCYIFSTSAAAKFALAFGAKTCEDAVTGITARITDQDAYTQLAPGDYLPPVSGSTVTVSSCDFPVTGGPRLGTFTVTRQDQGWEITDYAAQGPCAAPAGSATPTSGATTPGTTPPTAPGPPSEAPIPTGGFSGIPTG